MGLSVLIVASGVIIATENVVLDRTDGLLWPGIGHFLLTGATKVVRKLL